MKYVGIVLALIFSMVVYEFGSSPGMFDIFQNEFIKELNMYGPLIVIAAGMMYFLIKRIHS